MLTGPPSLTSAPHPTAHLSGVTANRDPKGSSQAKVSQFQLPILQGDGKEHGEGLFNSLRPASPLSASSPPCPLPVAPASQPPTLSRGGGYPVYEQVLGLQVPVQHVAAVTEPQAFQQLEEERLGGQGGGHQTPGQDAAPSQGDAPPSSLSALSQSPIRLAAVSSV